MVVDHRLPLALGGSDEPSNLWALCPACDRAKTRADRAEIRRSDVVVAGVGGMHPSRALLARASSHSAKKTANEGAKI
jgi:hypothetical protein